MIKRIYNIEKMLKPNRALIIYGPRRVGKTTLLKEFLNKTKLKHKLDIGDNIAIADILGSRDFKRISEYSSGFELIAIDEAQLITGVGMGLKIIVDNMPKIFVIATGSSFFDLSQQIGEPLTGRKNTIILYPISQKELKLEYNNYELKQRLEDFLIFGSYPEIITARVKSEKIKILEEIVNSYLLKDVLALERVKSPKILINLLKLLSFQVGSLVSLNELAGQLSIDVKTVARYLDLLEKSFVIKSHRGFSRNLRKEIAKKGKYYFLDNGIRNAVISQFNDLKDRDDVGKLFENFIYSERLKKLEYDNIYGSLYFWRTYEGQEIDIVEERDGKLEGYEIKWKKDKIKSPKDWLETYKNAEYKIINQDNYLEYII